MKRVRRAPANKIALLTGIILVLSVSSCFSPHYRDYKDDDPVSLEKFEPIPVERPNGLFATVGYSPSEDSAAIKLEAEPAITPVDIKEIRKNALDSGAFLLIEVRLNEKGSEKLFMLTKENIGKPLAFVVENKIIGMPMVMAATLDGEFSIALGFDEDEIDRIIEVLTQEKNK